MTARRLDGHRAEAGGGEGHGRAPGASLGRPCSAGASPSGTGSVAVGPRIACFLTPFASAAPPVSHVDPPSRPPRETVPPPRGPLATREAFTPESASRPRTSGSHARGGGNPASVLGKTSAFCLWPSPRPPSAHVLRPHLFPLSSVPWGSSRSPAPPGACSQPHRGQPGPTALAGRPPAPGGTPPSR